MMDQSRKPDPYSVEAGAAGSPSDAPGRRRFSTETRDGVHVVTFSQNEVLDAYEIDQLGTELKRYVETVDPPRVVIDLEPVHHLSSAALGMLISTKTTLDGRGGGLCLANVRDDLQQIFRLTNLHKMLKIHADLDRAVKSLG